MAAAVTMSPAASTPEPGAGVAYFESRAVAILAGRRAEVLALKPDAAGWRKVLAREEIVALHEAAHLVAARELGFVPYECRLAPGERYDGIACYGTTPERPPHLGPPEDLQTDTHRLVRDYCPALALARYGKITWRTVRACIRRLTVQTDELLAASWLLVWHIANALLREKTLNQVRIAELLNPHPRRESSL